MSVTTLTDKEIITALQAENVQLLKDNNRTNRERSDSCSDIIRKNHHIADLKQKFAKLEYRLSLGVEGEPHLQSCIDHSDSLMKKGGIPTHGNLYTLEWMLRDMVGRYHRDKNCITRLKAENKELKEFTDKLLNHLEKIDTLDWQIR